MPKVIVPLADGFEEIEALAPVDLLRRAGVEVTTAALADNRHATGRSGITVHADAALRDAVQATYDMVFLPGGAGVKLLRAESKVTELIKRNYQLGHWIAAICAAPVLLNDCGLLAGRRYTAHFSVAGELASILSDERIVTDGKITTSRGAGTALDFGLHLVGLLTGAEKLGEIRKSICH